MDDLEMIPEEFALLARKWRDWVDANNLAIFGFRVARSLAL